MWLKHLEVANSKTGRAWQPHAWKVRFLRRVVASDVVASRSRGRPQAGDAGGAPWFPRGSGSASAALLGHCAGEPELGEHAAVGEEGDLGDVAAGEGEHYQPLRPRDVCLRAREVAPESGLTVGSSRHEP